MPTIRDDSAGSYGTWNNDDLSWLDYLTAKASDGGNALANLGKNLAQGFSPIGTSEQGNMALQVPPIVSGIAQSYGRLAGSPSHPGNAYDLTGVPELDAPIQQDMSNVLLSLYGGNAVSGLTKPRGALGAGAMREEAAAPIRVYHGTDSGFDKFDPDKLTANTLSGARPNFADLPDEASGYAMLRAKERGGAPSVMPADLYVSNPFDGWITKEDGSRSTVPDDVYERIVGQPYRRTQYSDGTFSNPDGLSTLGDAWGARYRSHRDADGNIDNKAIWDEVYDALRAEGYDAIRQSRVPTDHADARHYTKYLPIKPGTVKSPFTGETLFSDTGKPSILGSAMAGSSADLSSPAANAITQPLAMDHASRMARARELGFDTPVFRGQDVSVSAMKPNTYWSNDPQVADHFAKTFSKSYRTENVPAQRSIIDKLLGRHPTVPQDVFDGYVGSHEGGMVYNGLLNTKGFVDVDWSRHSTDGLYSHRLDDMVEQNTQAPGYIFRNVRERDVENGGDRLPHTQYFVRDPSRIRSVNAAFDPARAGENGLLLSDTRPSLLGSALATAGENYDLPPWLQF